jgi:ubiquinone/menaquinone biosynthesis C-methylase UbiE
MPDINDVRNYWQTHPLFSYEVAEPGSPAFFDALDRIKKDDVERFSLRYWNFTGYWGKKVLDVGCGPGWITVQYATGGAEVHAMDLTKNAVDLTQKYLKTRNLTANVLEGNAEDIPFEDNFFDLVVSSGVLHHTPDTPRAVKECFRVLKPGGSSKLTFYRKGLLHGKFFFSATRRAMQLLGVKHPGANLAAQARDVDDFIRQYDGRDNPIGIGKTAREWASLLADAGFQVQDHEFHYFPLRLVPAMRSVLAPLHFILDRCFGTMVYFNLKK